MRLDEFCRSIRAAWSFLDNRIQVGEIYCHPASLAVNEDFNRVALKSDSTYVEIYQVAVSLSHYNIMLSDKALLQFSWEGDESWRLAYLPNPRLTGVRAALDEYADAEKRVYDSQMTLEDFGEFESSMKLHNAVPPIRYEYALGQHQTVVHPAAHFHIGRHAENRWGVTRRLSPFAFAMLIAKHYYPERWALVSAYPDGEGDECADQELMNELRQCYLVPNLPEAEMQTLHFAST